jgi:Arrestin (or S-antigen), N-terminal domain
LTDTGFKVENFSFSVYGEEKIEFYVPGGHASVKVSSHNIFFNEDLSHFVTYKQASIDENKTLEVSKGLMEIPFKFAIPENALESYRGKYASIRYGLNVNVGRYWSPKTSKVLPFTVTSPANTIAHDRVILEDKNNKNGICLKLELERNNISPGQTLKGKLTVENTQDKKKIKHAEVVLTGSEYVIGLTEEKFGVFIRRKLTREMTTRIDKHKANLELKEGDSSMDFEIHIPKGAKRSYIGRFSEYFWEIDAKLDIPWAKDFHLKHIIDIV